MKLTLKLKNSMLVAPAEPTCRDNIHLSEFDVIGTLGHVPIVHLHRPPQNWLSPPETIFNTLQTSLAKLLVPYYQMAGRLRAVGYGRFEIVCNGTGALLVEAEAEFSEMDDVRESEYRDLTPHFDVATTPLDNFPLVAVQITRFTCGGVAIVFAISHAVLDGRSSTDFMRQWGRVARGEPLEELVVDRSVLVNLGRDYPYTVLKPPVEFNSPPPLDGRAAAISGTCSTVTVRMTEFQVEELKRKVNYGHAVAEPLFTRFEAIAAHIWRSACKAWQYKSEQETRLSMSVDFRKHIGLPKCYVGNAVLDVVACSTLGDVVRKPLSYAAGKLRETIKKVDADYVKATAVYLRSVDLSCFQDSVTPVKKVPTLLVTSWLTRLFRGVDFGWGQELYMCPVNYGHEGECVIVPGYDESAGSVLVTVCFQDCHIEAFKKSFQEDLLKTRL